MLLPQYSHCNSGRTLVAPRLSSLLQAGSAGCHNSHSNVECWGYKKAGMCQCTQQKWMRQHCALTCGFCEISDDAANTAAAAAADLERIVENEMVGDMQQLKQDLTAMSGGSHLAQSPLPCGMLPHHLLWHSGCLLYCLIVHCERCGARLGARREDLVGLLQAC